MGLLMGLQGYYMGVPVGPEGLLYGGTPRSSRSLTGCFKSFATFLVLHVSLFRSVTER